jgi:hypothetical protein
MQGTRRKIAKLCQSESISIHVGSFFPIRNKTKNINLPLQAVSFQFLEHQSKVFPAKIKAKCLQDGHIVL